MSGYPPIADHGLIGDLQTAALVATDGTIDWFCCPRFDSPERLRSLLDASRAGGSHRRRRRRLRHQADVPARHRRAGHPVPLRGRRRRGDRLHAHRRPRRWPPTATGWSGWCGACAARSVRARSSRGSTTARRAHELELTTDGAVFEPTRRLDPAPAGHRPLERRRRRRARPVHGRGRRDRRASSSSRRADGAATPIGTASCSGCSSETRTTGAWIGGHVPGALARGGASARPSPSS